ncbi:MAG: DNA-processing protein DprA [Pseudomonadota bacterium]
MLDAPDLPLDDCTDAERLAWLRLSRSRNVGSVSFCRLLRRYGSAAKALEMLPELAARGGARAYQACSERQGVEEMERANSAGARMLRFGAPDYPVQLAEITDPPPFLWALGRVALAHRGAVALVGARNASSLGLRMARLLAGDLGARGHVITSGFARGVDTAAHDVALETGTVAVFAGGVDHIYPKENQALYQRMMAEGLILSEAPMGLEPQGRHFPRRNRIVSGLSDGVVLIEAALRSGSLITARCALEQGREAMAVPGSPLDARSTGCNDLIRQGAALVRDADDVEDALAAPRTLNFEEGSATFVHDELSSAVDPDLTGRAAALLSTAPIDIDTLARDLSVSAAHLAEALMDLELAGVVERRTGGLVALAQQA